MKKYILPSLAAVLVIAAAVVIFAIPRGGAAEADGGYVARDGSGSVVISASELSEGQISFYKFAEDSKIELIAVRGARHLPVLQRLAERVLHAKRRGAAMQQLWPDVSAVDHRRQRRGLLSDHDGRLGGGALRRRSGDLRGAAVGL